MLSSRIWPNRVFKCKPKHALSRERYIMTLSKASRPHLPLGWNIFDMNLTVGGLLGYSSVNSICNLNVPIKAKQKTYPINFVSPRIKEANVHKASYVNQKNSLPSSNGVSLGLRRNRKNCWKGSFMLPYGTGCNWNVLAIQVHSKLIIIYLPEDNSVPNHNVVITRSSANTVWGLVWNSRKLKQKARSLKNN